MASYAQRVSILEFLYRKSGISLTDVSAIPENLECLRWDIFDNLLRSKADLQEQVTALEVRNKELERYAHMVAHDLKEPLTVLILTADLINNIPVLTSDEFRKYLLSIKSAA